MKTATRQLTRRDIPAIDEGKEDRSDEPMEGFEFLPGIAVAFRMADLLKLDHGRPPWMNWKVQVAADLFLTSWP